MAVHTHEITKSSRSQEETLPDINGDPIVYAGNVQSEISVKQRRNDEPTITAGTTQTVGGRTGVCVEASARSLPQFKLDSAVVWEADYRLRVNSDTV